MADKIEKLCMEIHFIYGYRTITCLLKKVYNLVVNRKKVRKRTSFAVSVLRRELN
ncbi:IS3 family transposase [uncultured Streptococcus sp.]|uniref:IS3 family transposase n=1 Tax=uncultured Streptococcus sp. TaxID=83427 RepID=UPI0034586EFA